MPVRRSRKKSDSDPNIASTITKEIVSLEKSGRRSSAFGMIASRVVNRLQTNVTLNTRNFDGELTEKDTKDVPEKAVRASCVQVHSIHDSFCKSSNLQQLRCLELVNGELSSLPDSIELLGGLREIVLTANKFTEFPLVLLKLKQLRKVKLSFNHIKTIPDEIDQLPDLYNFTAENNYIHFIPNCMTSMKSLQKVMLMNNPLIRPPLYVLEKGWDATKKYLDIVNLEQGNDITKFDFRFVSPFVTSSIFSCSFTSFSSPEDNRLFLTEDIKEWKDNTNSNYYFSLQIGLRLEQGCRNYMEDRAEAKALEPFPKLLPGFKVGFIGVYDGHGGSTAVDMVKENLRRIIIKKWRDSLSEGLDKPLDENTITIPEGTERDQLEKLSLTLLPDILKQSFLEMDSLIENRWKVTGVDDGTTAVITLIIHNKLYVAHAGDSRAILCRGTTSLALTADHKPNLPAEKQRIEAAGGTVKRVGHCYRVNNSLAVSRSLGDCNYKPAVSAEPTVSEITLSPIDSYVILASDGLWDVVTNQEVVDVVLSQIGAAEASDKLVKVALQKGTEDNITAVVLALRWGINEDYTKDYLNDISSAASSPREVIKTSPRDLPDKIEKEIKDEIPDSEPIKKHKKKRKKNLSSNSTNSVNALVTPRLRKTKTKQDNTTTDVKKKRKRKKEINQST